jgi:ribulose-bisphosphate carboxylase small chain
MVAITASIACAPVAVAKCSIKPASAKAAPVKAVSNVTAKKATAFQVWTPINNKFFETFSFLPPLSDDEITKQVEYIVRNGFTPCLEFSDPENAYIASVNTERMGDVTCNYYDNRYWSMWKLPMFGCQDGAQVLAEISACTKAFPDAYIRLVAFDNVRQVQCSSLLVHRPPAAKEYQSVDKRSL